VEKFFIFPIKVPLKYYCWNYLAGNCKVSLCQIGIIIFETYV